MEVKNISASPFGMIEVGRGPWEAMVLHAERTYPNECCGAMLGHIQGDKKTVIEAVPIENASTGEQRQHYELRPEDLLSAEKAARHRGLDLVGIFHSHPDCDAYFSETDLRNSCPWYSFVVLSIKSGRFDHANSFLPDVDQTRADREELIWQKS
jgi:proteasome lid subunit RPN8/RPN11